MRLDDGSITIWSIQTLAALESLYNRGRLISQWQFADKDYHSAYRWMARQMRYRLNCSDRIPPVWAWHSYRGKSKRKPDLRHKNHLPKGVTGARLELYVPKSYVLLSQFEMWNWILNSNPIPFGWREYNRMQSETANVTASHQWDSIFNLDWGSDAFWGRKSDRAIQACLPQIRNNWVVRIDYCTS